jgi:hypothetical protein
MGALAAQKYAECHPVSALALLTPVVSDFGPAVCAHLLWVAD